MHWFWRAAVAVGAGVVVTLSVTVPAHLLGSATQMAGVMFGNLIAGFVIFNAACLRTYHKLTWAPEELHDAAETRCRRCSYILKGLTKPRCPECGEPI